MLAAVVAFSSVAASVLDHEVRWRDVGFQVVSPGQVRVTFEVYGRDGDQVRCQVRAADARYGDVGQVEVDLGPLTGAGEQVTVEVRTLAEASSASVRTCVLVPGRYTAPFVHRRSSAPVVGWSLSRGRRRPAGRGDGAGRDTERRGRPACPTPAPT